MRKNDKKKIKERFYPLTYRMIDSPAWQRLSGNAVKVYIQLMRKRNGNNDKDLSLTYHEMTDRMSSTTFRRCLIELVESGFIDMVRRGGLQRQCNIFGISERWKDYGTAIFKCQTLEKWNYGGFGMQKKKRVETEGKQNQV